MSTGLWGDVVEVLGHFVRSRHLVQGFARGRVDEDALRSGLEAIEERVAVLRRRHALLEGLVTLLGRPMRVQRSVGWLLALAAVSVVVRCARAD